MSGYDISRGRLQARWRKLRRDPAAFADDLPWPLVRGAALTALAGWTKVSAAVDRREARAARCWRQAGVALRRDADGDYRLLGADGLAPALWPHSAVVEGEGRRLVVCVFGAGGALVSACEAAPGRPGVLVLGEEPSRVRAYAVDGGGEPPAVIATAPADRAGLAEQAREDGAGLPEALRAAWPAQQRRPSAPSMRAYRDWIARNEPGPEDEAKLRAWTRRLVGAPSISILMPVKDPRPSDLEAAIASVSAQWFDDWELVVCDDGSRDATVRAVLDRAEDDPRVTLVRLGASRGVAVATNAALEKATGEVCLFMDHDDLLAPHALALIAGAFAETPLACAAYTDEDVIDTAGRRSNPVFKGDFDGERLLAHNYLNHAFAVRTALLRRLGGIHDGLDGAQDHDLALRVASAGAGDIVHIPHVLYHWRVFPGGANLSQRERARMDHARLAAVRAHLGRVNPDGAGGGDARLGAYGQVEIIRALPVPPPRVLAIVPTRDRPALLRACVAGLLVETDYPALELCIVDNGSRDPETLTLLAELEARPGVRVLRVDAPFNFSALCNAGARAATAAQLAFINDDILVAEPGWLKLMAAEAARPDVGAVGAMLLYPNGRIQHAGVSLGVGPQGAAGHDLRGRPGDDPGPQNRLRVQRLASAVTAACLVVEREKFEAVGGFDETLFPVAFNDVDLCLRLADRGWRTIWTPRARLIHLESATRGSERTPERAAAFANEARALKARWGAVLAADPNYNPNLTQADESFGLAPRSRAEASWR